jgi:hypothetical protein
MMKTKLLTIVAVLLGMLVLATCSSKDRVGELRSESQSIRLEDTSPVRVEVNLGAGRLDLAGGARELMEADFTYNVARLKPVVEYAEGTLLVKQPASDGMSNLQGIAGFRNEWGVRLSDEVPMDLRVDVGGGASELRLAGLSLTRLDVKLGAGTSTLDLDGGWASDLNITIDAGATDLTVRLPADVGVRVEVDRGPTIINAPDLAQDGNVYTNAAYGTSEVTLRIKITTGVGFLNLQLTDAG